MPLTSHHVKIVDLVVSVVSSHDAGPATLFGIGKLLLGEDAVEKKVDDKDK